MEGFKHKEPYLFLFSSVDTGFRYLNPSPERRYDPGDSFGACLKICPGENSGEA